MPRTRTRPIDPIRKAHYLIDGQLTIRLSDARFYGSEGGVPLWAEAASDLLVPITPFGVQTLGELTRSGITLAAITTECLNTIRRLLSGVGREAVGGSIGDDRVRPVNRSRTARLSGGDWAGSTTFRNISELKRSWLNRIGPGYWSTTSPPWKVGVHEPESDSISAVVNIYYSFNVLHPATETYESLDIHQAEDQSDLTYVTPSARIQEEFDPILQGSASTSYQINSSIQRTLAYVSRHRLLNGTASAQAVTRSLRVPSSVVGRLHHNLKVINIAKKWARETQSKLPDTWSPELNPGIKLPDAIPEEGVGRTSSSEARQVSTENPDYTSTATPTPFPT